MGEKATGEIEFLAEEGFDCFAILIVRLDWKGAQGGAHGDEGYGIL